MAEQSFWMRAAIAGIAASSEATFPENDLGAPDWKSTDMVPRTLEYLDELPPRQRRLLVLLFAFVELAAVFLVLGFRRFSRLPALRRTQVIANWRSSRFLPFRVLGDSLKATTTMMYMSHPSAIAYVGEYRVCERPLDRVKIAVRPRPEEPA
ncbi:MAG: hypothetical protein IPM35_02740 [Myxococcales bacterium]|nr:hypothetical protein [Myxococcales bacterium]